jgi:hypothetical protein
MPGVSIVAAWISARAAALFSTTAQAFLADHTLAEEVFGAASLVVRCPDLAIVPPASPRARVVTAGLASSAATPAQ